jgi:hypothetical protein
MIVTSKQNNLLTEAIINAVQEQIIFWSDDRMCHWFFDFKVDGVWVSVMNINNELTHCEVDLFKG